METTELQLDRIRVHLFFPLTELPRTLKHYHPLTQQSSNVGGIHTLQELFNQITVFGFSFLILISVWMRYSKIMSVLPLGDRWTISLHIAVLFTVSLEPSLLNVMLLGYNGIKDPASQICAVDLGVMMIIMAGFTSSRRARRFMDVDLSVSCFIPCIHEDFEPLMINEDCD